SHVAVQFSSLHNLAAQLLAGLPLPRQFCGNWFKDCDPIARGEIVRLAIMAHGDQGGKAAVNGKQAPIVLTASNVATYHDDLHNIGLFTREQGATILLMGCLAGQGPAGTRLLITLSQFWPGRRVVSSTTLGYRPPGPMKRRGEVCELPGMRDTNAQADFYATPPLWDKQWLDFAIPPLRSPA